MSGPPTERVPGEGLVHGRGPHLHSGVAGPRVGVLALQGDVLEHLRILGENGATGVVVKHADDLDGLEGIVVPGGESTAIGKLAAMYGLLDPLRERLRDGLPAFGTCAGAILLSRQALLHDGRTSDQPLFEVLDAVVRRNAFGRQVASFETGLAVTGVNGGPLHAVFIRAPWFEKVGPDVEVLATVDTPLGEKIVVVRQGHLLASAFHPELSGDGRLHRLFLDSLRAG